MEAKFRLPEKARYFLYTLLTCVLCVGCGSNIKNIEVMENKNIEQKKEYRYGCGMGVDALNLNTTGQNNGAIGWKPLTTPYVVDTVVYCDKCKSEHIINIDAYSKETLYIANCGCEFSVSGNAR